MQLISSAYEQGAAIPTRYTCEGENISPEFSWKDAPPETKSFVLIIHDPDAPRREGFTHWVVYNIPPGVAHIEPNVPHGPDVAGLGMQAANDAGKLGYMGPCPPSGRHRYFARVYALRSTLNLKAGVPHAEVTRAMEGQIIEQAELMGTYAKGSKKAA
jgi:Raf kinase inhibitor-like YbhB/YbcL family protein